MPVQDLFDAIQRADAPAILQQLQTLPRHELAEQDFQGFTPLIRLLRNSGTLQALGNNAFGVIQNMAVDGAMKDRHEVSALSHYLTSRAHFDGLGQVTSEETVKFLVSQDKTALATPQTQHQISTQFSPQLLEGFQDHLRYQQSLLALVLASRRKIHEARQHNEHVANDAEKQPIPPRTPPEVLESLVDEEHLRPQIVTPRTPRPGGGF